MARGQAIIQQQHQGGNEASEHDGKEAGVKQNKEVLFGFKHRGREARRHEGKKARRQGGKEARRQGGKEARRQIV